MGQRVRGSLVSLEHSVPRTVRAEKVQPGGPSPVVPGPSSPSAPRSRGRIPQCFAISCSASDLQPVGHLLPCRLSRAWPQTPAVLLKCYVILRRFPNLSGPQYPHLQDGDDGGSTTSGNRGEHYTCDILMVLWEPWLHHSHHDPVAPVLPPLSGGLPSSQLPLGPQAFSSQQGFPQTGDVLKALLLMLVPEVPTWASRRFQEHPVLQLSLFLSSSSRARSLMHPVMSAAESPAVSPDRLQLLTPTPFACRSPSLSTKVLPDLGCPPAVNTAGLIAAH